MPKPEPTEEEIAAEAEERARVDATPVGALAKLTYEAAMRRSGLGEARIPGAWEALHSKLRVQWIAGAELAFEFVGSDLGALDAVALILGEPFDDAGLDRFLDFFEGRS